ncbi:restriction endonuclease subunit S [Staphylococcus hominis]|uniref:restriction endonuclease subunit S n=1 Tax=Staphylococcus hominis TaxID=1290 RepID=UPI00136F9BA8|nr:restriction endonuclease subunit S [Staphylococcus hominis]NAM95782.1 restriction endonuclease subunit S [Staphylococcus hominis]
MTEQTNTPKLRFPEFSEEWENKSITDDFSIIDGDRGKHYPSSKDLLKKGDCIFLSAENITKKGWSFKNLKFITRKKDISMGKGKLKLNDLILTTRGTVGNVVRYHEEIPFQDMRINSGMVILRTIQPSQFFLTLFTSNFMKRFLNKVTVQSAQPHLTVATIKTMKFFIPKSIKEQEKIGTFFSKLDRQIELEEKKLELLEQQKRGYIQKIFSQGLRFKDEEGNYYKEWDTKQLKDVLEFSNKRTTNENEYPVLTSSRQGLILQSDYYKDGKTFAESNIGYFILPKNYITYRSRSDDGIFKFNLNQIIDVGIISKYYPVFKGINTNQYYLTLHLNYQLKKEYIKYATGTSQLVLSKKNLQNIQTKLPSYEEQTKIANFLSELDKLIEKQSDKVELLKDRKKGLLQKMFV